MYPCVLVSKKKKKSSYQAVTLIFPYKNQKSFNHQHNTSLLVFFLNFLILQSHVQQSFEMAQVSNVVKRASVVAVVALSAAAAVSAQATAPAPSPDAGAAVSIPVSGLVIGSSMLLSLLALFKN
ncbi:hypothetical protein L1987_50999 [Smallanthus sonchifolius]|uniref:Uncharacterized protein n=1 Tax=Smallanthus sonchifolius TaxID=185202 RepID=A0ACB9EQ73_9ASTR|nr:hypothetical protein L1987_50999 [Smallanthus sonchifolius]